ncbi:hypothetical protein JQ599_09780 [Bradyrhizobium diazoefficiens]|nr:hypothetical protein [Bradyrhizobium diazoefficiens]MBR0700189.1 hypothetical protein [Bradyrhizobium diazoefficiens]MBR0768524.1 hypothetical protein [Bradyrhizobium diazoefficiens]
MGVIATIAACINLGITIFGGFAFLMAVKSHQAVQDVLLENMSKSLARLDETVEGLRRGNGWIQAPPGKHVDREY